LIPLIVMSLGLIFTWVLFYYLYRLVLKLPSKIMAVIVLTFVISIFALLVPWYSYVIIDYLNDIGLTYDKSYWEVLLGLLMMGTMGLNALYGVVLIIKLILTPYTKRAILKMHG
jgi:hypothetical protein